MRDDTLDIGSWVEVRDEPGRGGRHATVAVNLRDGIALRLDDAERLAMRGERPSTSEFTEVLAAHGFLAHCPAPVPAPRQRRLVRFLRTFDTHWTGADRAVAAAHDRVLHRAWRPRWLAAQCLVALAGLVAFVAALRSGRPLELRPALGQIPLYLGLSFVAIVVHELAHGVVLTHHGRKVAAVGFRLHLGSPAFYVESVEALLLTRRQRLIQAGAGVWAEWQFTSVVALVLWLAPAGAWTPMLQRFVLLTVFTIATNLLPFSGLDGALLFADLVREPNLASDGKEAIGRIGRDRRPGDGFLSAYAVANTVVSGGLLVTACLFWYLLFGRLLGDLTRHGVLGWAGAAALLAVSFGPALAGLGTSLRRLTSLDRVAFRFERRARVRFAEQFAATAPFDRLDEHQLGILAGQLHLRRISRSRPLHEQGFAGYVVVDGPVELSSGMALGSPPVAKIDGPGVAATVTRRLVRARAGLLPNGSLQLLDLPVPLHVGRGKQEARVATS